MDTVFDKHQQAIKITLQELPQWSQISQEQQEQWVYLSSVSDFTFTTIKRDSDYFLHPDFVCADKINHNWLQREFISLYEPLDQSVKATAIDEAIMRALRILRRRAMVHIIANDISRRFQTLETTMALSLLADFCIDFSVKQATELLAMRFGQPRSSQDNSVQNMLVIGMGKLGAHELNLSSDIDLIFAYEHSGNTDGKKSISNQEFFIKVGQKVIQYLDRITPDGFVFRTDMRLRPYGESGPLVMNFASLTDYYQTQGRDWERYALIKARIINHSETAAANHLISILRPFTYRQYVDYSAIESIRSMKKLIQTEVRRRGLDDNVKLGAGGIREIEFIVQTFQLIRGGQDPALQNRSLNQVLDHLQNDSQLPLEVCEELWQAYVWLRNTEHAIQCIRDEQTQRLPSEPLDQTRICKIMGCDDWSQFHNILEVHRSKVSQHFSQLISHEEQTDEEDHHSLWWLWWHDKLELNNEEYIEQYPELSDKPLALVMEVDRRVRSFRQQRAVQTMQAIAKDRLDRLMPVLMNLIWQQQDVLTALDRVIPLLEAILRRSVYLTLLNENPQAIKQLIRLCSASPWVAAYITNTPLLLDELLDTASLYSLPNFDDLRNELHVKMLRIEAHDLEQQMETLRHFVHTHKLRAAACEVLNLHPLMKISDYLTWAAEASMETVMLLAWQQMVDKYGYPTDINGDAVAYPEFLVVGYGKLGGIELSYTSDLDMVFIHNGLRNRETNGDRAIENGVFYTRMGQRMVHILTTQTRSGAMYDVDLRLRPSGNSGMIVTSLKAFDEYQANHAWTWEHQALVRARIITGDYSMREQYEEIRAKILQRPRELAILGEEIRAMRQKMRDNLGAKKSDARRFHLKQDAGGIVDIEFLVQFGVLAWSQQHPRLLTTTDNMRLLDAFTDLGLIDPKDRQTLQDTYLAYRAETHRRALQNQSLVLDDSEMEALDFERRRHSVIECWNRWLPS